MSANTTLTAASAEQSSANSKVNGGAGVGSLMPTTSMPTLHLSKSGSKSFDVPSAGRSGQKRGGRRESLVAPPPPSVRTGNAQSRFRFIG